MTDDHLHHKIEALEDELAALRSEFSRLVDAAVNVPNDPETENAGDAGDAQRARNKLEREVEKAADAARLVLREVDEASKRHPTGSLIVAFAAGLLISRIFGPGRR